MAHLDILEADMARAGARADAEIRNAGRVELAIKHEAVDDEVLALAKFNGPRPAGALRARGRSTVSPGAALSVVAVAQLEPEGGRAAP